VLVRVRAWVCNVCESSEEKNKKNKTMARIKRRCSVVQYKNLV